MNMLIMYHAHHLNYSKNVKMPKSTTNNTKQAGIMKYRMSNITQKIIQFSAVA